MVSGDKKVFEKSLTLVEKIASNVFFLEKPGLATKMKLINNMVLGAFMAALSEAIVLGENTGIDKEQVIEILSAGAGNSVLLNAKKEKLLNEDFSPHFSAAMLNKDLNYFTELIQSLNKPSFLGAITKQLYATALKEDFKNKDFSVMYEVMKRLS